jgi:hypothetical protein
MAATLVQLADLISDNVNKYIDLHANAGFPVPTLDEPIISPSAMLPPSPELMQSILLIHSAASQLIATVLPTPLILVESVTSVCSFAGLGQLASLFLCRSTTSLVLLALLKH